MKTALVFDIGGTKLSHCFVNENGEIISEITKIDTPRNSVLIYDYLKSIVAENEQSVDKIAIATAGCVNNENTKVVGSTGNLPLGYSELDFTSLSKKNVFIENDANAAAWAEYKIGAAKDFKHSIIITLGTGIGGGIIINNNLLKGSQGLAGEVGSIKISYDKKRKCSCKNYDCWESYASGTGLKITAEEIAKSDDLFKNSIYSDKSPTEITTYDIIEGTKQNDAYSKKVYDIWNYHIFCGLISLVNIFNPECIIFSGGLGAAADTNWLEKELNNQSVVSDVKIVSSHLKNHTGMIGAALMALENSNNNLQ